VEINSECDCDACTTFIYKQWMLFMGFTVVIHVRGSDSYIYIYRRLEQKNSCIFFFFTFDRLKHVFWSVQQVHVSGCRPYDSGKDQIALPTRIDICLMKKGLRSGTRVRTGHQSNCRAI
jgi:hypothetical protein